MILLDTCVFLWMASAQEELSEVAKNTIGDNTGNLYLSSISAFEIAIKSRNGKLKLPLPAPEWIQMALELHGIEELPVHSRIATQSALLPLIHKDPCDRFIIATAQIYHMQILTRDRTIPKYPDVQVVW